MPEEQRRPAWRQRGRGGGRVGREICISISGRRTCNHGISCIIVVDTSGDFFFPGFQGFNLKSSHPSPNSKFSTPTEEYPSHG